MQKKNNKEDEGRRWRRRDEEDEQEEEEEEEVMRKMKKKKMQKKKMMMLRRRKMSWEGGERPWEAGHFQCTRRSCSKNTEHSETIQQLAALRSFFLPGSSSTSFEKQTQLQAPRETKTVAHFQSAGIK